MIIYVGGKRWTEAELPAAGEYAVIFIDADTLQTDAGKLGLDKVLLPLIDESAANRFESHEMYECVLLNIPDQTEDIEAPPINIDVYYNQNRIIFVHDPSPAIDRLQAKMEAAAPLPYDQVLYTFFNLLTEKDASYLEEIEEAIANLEDDITEDASENYQAEISTLRKKLLKQKRYFESLIDTLEDMEKNTNKYLTKAQLKYFHIITNRADRQFHSVLNLRDYVTQVRESYQAQIDISLNRTMKLFTVITAIFLPLTLLVGWYGMNLQIPEFDWPFMYPLIIIISVVVVVGMLIYFKVKKWF